MRGELQGLLIGEDPSSLGPNGQDPHFELHHNVKGLKQEDSGSVSYIVETSLTAHLNSAVEFKPLEIRLYGDSETKGAIIGKTLHTADGREKPV